MSHEADLSTSLCVSPSIKFIDASSSYELASDSDLDDKENRSADFIGTNFADFLNYFFLGFLNKLL